MDSVCAAMLRCVMGPDISLHWTTRIGRVCGPQERVPDGPVEGYLQAMKDAGIVVDERLIKIAAFQRHYGAEATAELLDLPDRPTAIFAAGGELVIGAMKTFFSKGVDVPGEISVIGFDDPDWFSFWRPPITTVAIDTEQLAQKIVELLLKRENTRYLPRGERVCPVNLVVRRPHTVQACCTGQQNRVRVTWPSDSGNGTSRNDFRVQALKV